MNRGFGWVLGGHFFVTAVVVNRMSGATISDHHTLWKMGPRLR